MMRQISANIQNATFFTIMADETADVFSKELVICIRWVDDCFVTHKDFIRMHPLERTNADQVVAILKNALPRINTNIQRALWDWSLTGSKHTEMKTRIQGVKSMMKALDFYFGCTLEEQRLRQTDSLGRALQDSSTSAA